MIRAASEDEVIADFLRAEIDSDRFDQAIPNALRADGHDRSIVDSPDFANNEENAYRRSLLGQVRGWGRGEGLFQGFPSATAWQLVALTQQELAAMHYINWDWWLERLGGSRLAPDYAQRIQAGEFPGDPELGLRSHWPIARRIRGGPPLPRLTAVRDRTQPEFLVLVEGHVRLTAFFLFPELLPAELELYLGTAEGLGTWGLY